MPTNRRDLRRRLFSLAAEQGGHFTASEAKDLGYSYQAQDYHVRAGNWLRVDRGLFRLTEWVPGVHDDLARWTLWSRGRGVVSHVSALSVDGIGEFETSTVHLTVPAGFTKRDGAVYLHHDDLPPSDVSQRTGFRMTTPLRSLIDVAIAVSDEDQLGRAIDDALQRGMVTPRRLRSRAEAIDVRAALFIERALQRIGSP